MTFEFVDYSKYPTTFPKWLPDPEKDIDVEIELIAEPKIKLNEYTENHKKNIDAIRKFAKKWNYKDLEDLLDKICIAIV